MDNVTYLYKLNESSVNYPRPVTLFAAICAIIFSIVGVLGKTCIKYFVIFQIYCKLKNNFITYYIGINFFNKATIIIKRLIFLLKKKKKAVPKLDYPALQVVLYLNRDLD